MLIDDSIIYEKNHEIAVNKEKDPFFYHFDYDERSAEINMRFQHFHPYYEILILLAPKADHLLDGKCFHLTMGDMILLAPYRLHKSVYMKGAKSKRVIISFQFPEHEEDFHQGYEELLSLFSMDIPIFRFSSKQKTLLYSKLNDILDFSKLPNRPNESLYNLMIHTKFIDFLNTLLTLKPYNTYKNIAYSTQSEATIYEISSYIHTHFTESINLEQLAATFFLNPYYLSHQFKNVTGFTITAYIQMTRIRNVQYLLATTKLKITEIAQASGFSSFSQFNRIFTKYTNMAPRDYRKQVTNNND